MVGDKLPLHTPGVNEHNGLFRRHACANRSQLGENFECQGLFLGLDLIEGKALANKRRKVAITPDYNTLQNSLSTEPSSTYNFGMLGFGISTNTPTTHIGSDNADHFAIRL
jgi:hypothetical protein